MAKLGQTQTLKVDRISVVGCVLNGDALGDIMLLPQAGANTLAVGDSADVFVYRDADGATMATTVQPAVVAGQVACLEVVALTAKGAFLDWGMHFDLFVPRSEQLGDMRVGSRCVVYAFLDENSERMIATARLHEHLSEYNQGQFKQGQQVQVLVCQSTELGFRVVIEGTHLGMVYHNEVFSKISIGDAIPAFVKEVRGDDKLDLTLQRAGRQQLGGVEAEIIAHLQAGNGTSTLTDKSPPEAIYKQFGVSKKVYKQALGSLYKKRMIEVSKQVITLVGA
jgi:predicted RNA-binding protein (virulence factor B family)